MSQPSGTRRYRCPYCGEMYTRTNWMVRRGIMSDSSVVLKDTHQIACYSRQRRKQELREELERRSGTKHE